MNRHDDATEATIERVLRARGAGELPPELAARIMTAVEGIPQRRRGWSLASWVPTAAVVGAAAVLTLAVIATINGRGPVSSPVGAPPPEESSSAGPAVTPSIESHTEPTTTTPDAIAEDSMCTNAEDGYSLTYPESWFVADASAPACSYFAPEPLATGDGMPSNVAVSVEVLSGDVGLSGEVVDRQTVTVAGREAERIEQVGVPGAMLADGERMYQYIVFLDGVSPEQGGRTLVATAFEHTDFQDHMAVLDRMMESLILADQ